MGLFNIYRLVKPDGVLVYSTCSIDLEENEDRVSAFLLRHPVGATALALYSTPSFHLIWMLTDRYVLFSFSILIYSLLGDRTSKEIL